jgi:hypothetical protein
VVELDISAKFSSYAALRTLNDGSIFNRSRLGAGSVCGGFHWLAVHTAQKYGRWVVHKVKSLFSGVGRVL